MNFEVDIEKLGQILKTFDENFNLKVLMKSELSGGWITISGNASIEKYPHKRESNGCSGKDNIIHIKITEGAEEGIIVKITGVKNRKFNIDIAESRYREINLNNGLNLNNVKINSEECKMRIDDKIIFTINSNMDNIKRLLKMW